MSEAMDTQQIAALPEEITIYWCDGCGRTKMFHPMSHFAWGKRCTGTVHEVAYRRAIA